MTKKAQKNDRATLQRLTLRQLQARLKKLTGKATKSKNRASLIERCVAAIDAGPPKPKPHKTRRRLPVGTVLTRTHKGEEICVTATEAGFEYDGEIYSSLSTLAKAITGYHISGPAFFQLDRK